MALTNSDQSRIRHYLLGQLSEDEQQTLEERIMVEDDLFQELEISKGELIEEYCAGELNRKERKLFQKTYLSSKEGRERYAFVQAMDRSPVLNSNQPQPSSFDRLRFIFMTHPWMTATAVATMAVVLGLIFFRPQPQMSYSVTLAHTLPTRSDGSRNPLPITITLPTNTGELRAQLQLPKRFPEGVNFEAQLDNRSDIKPVEVVAHDESVVTVSIPTSDLQRAEYALKLIAIMADGSREEIPGSYRFDIK